MCVQMFGNDAQCGKLRDTQLNSPISGQSARPTSSTTGQTKASPPYQPGHLEDSYTLVLKTSFILQTVCYSVLSPYQILVLQYLFLEYIILLVLCSCHAISFLSPPPWTSLHWFRYNEGKRRGNIIFTVTKIK